MALADDLIETWAIHDWIATQSPLVRLEMECQRFGGRGG
jgi:hypothetical protein